MIPLTRHFRKVRFVSQFFNIKFGFFLQFQHLAILEVQGSNLAIRLETLRCSLFNRIHILNSIIIFFLQSGVKFSSDTKEFAVSIPGKGNAVFNLENKVKT